MGTFIAYILRAALCLTVLYLPYTLLLRKQTTYTLNRILLLSILVTSFIIPSVHINRQLNSMKEVHISAAYLQNKTSEYIDNAVKVVIPRRKTAVSVTPYSSPAKAEISPSAYKQTRTERYGWMIVPLIILFSYFIGAFTVLIIRATQIIKISKYVHKNVVWKRRLDNGATLYCHSDKVCPFSWMRSIVISQADMNNDNNQSIIAHESAHTIRWHSIDILLISIVEVLQWFNPVIWLLHQDLSTIHEYEADKYVLRHGFQRKQYQLFLLSRVTEMRFQKVVNGFSQPSLKSRIIMMMRSKSSKWTTAKYIYLVPMSIFAIFAFASPKIDAMVKKIDESKNIIIDKINNHINSTDTVIKKVEEKPAIVPIDGLDNVDIIKINRKGSSKIGNGEIMKLNNYFNATLTSKQYEGATLYYLSILNKENNIVSQKYLGKDDDKTDIDIQCSKSKNPNRLMQLDAGETIDTDNWLYDSHQQVWRNNKLIKGNEMWIDKQGIIKTGRKFETSINSNGDNKRINESAKTDVYTGLNVSFIKDLVTQAPAESNFWNYAEAKRCEAMLLSQQLKNEKVYTEFDKAPQFLGSKSEMNKYLSNRFKNTNKYNRTIFVNMIIRSDGTVTDVHCLSGIDYDLKRNIENIFYAMPKWQPAKKNRKAISAAFNMPVTFSHVTKEQKYSDDMQFVRSLFNTCVSYLSYRDKNINDNISKQYLTNEMRSTLKKPVANTLLGSDYIDEWAERKYDVFKLPYNWYLINYASEIFTENGKYKQTAVHLTKTIDGYKIDRISANPTKDEVLIGYIHSMCFDQHSLEIPYWPNFKSLDDGTSIVALCNVKEVGKKTATVTFIYTWDKKFKDIKVEDEYSRYEGGGKVSDEVKKVIVDKLLSITDFHPGTICGIPTNVKVIMSVTSGERSIMIR
jgi:beta-lactamase regulating signal transducer with metallopeptidase domain